jgi:hypothetical protein
LFVARAKGLSDAEAAKIVDQGIEYARKTIALDPLDSFAMTYLSFLYEQREARESDTTERARWRDLAERAARDALKSNRPPRPNDQFSRPAAPPASALPPASR